MRRALPYLFCSAVFIGSRLVYRQEFGIAFDHSPVDFFIQYVDPWFLENDLWRSILYLHHQAPLQNLMVGLAIDAFGRTDGYAALNLVYVAFGFCVVLALLHAMLRLGARPLLAVLITTLYTLNPTTVLYENWLFYHVPITCLLLLSLNALIAHYRSGDFRSAFGCFGALALAALFRSTLGPQLMAAVIALLLWRPPALHRARRSARRTILLAAAGPLLVLCANTLKPTLLIGYGYGEALAWGNIVPKIYETLPTPERRRLQDKHLVSRAASIFCLTDLRGFGDLRIPHEPTGVPLLDMERAPNGRWNAHALEYLLIARKYYKPDAEYLLWHYPWKYLQSVRNALGLYAAPCTNDMVLPATANYARLRKIIHAIDEHLGSTSTPRLWWLTIWFPLLVAYGCCRMLRANDRSQLERPVQIGIAYALLLIVYVTATTTMISFGDFSRYRYDIDPLYLALGALFGSDLLRFPQLVRALNPLRPSASRAS